MRTSGSPKLTFIPHSRPSAGYDFAAVEASIRSALPRYLEDLAPGSKVVLKPNWVRESDTRAGMEHAWEHVITHPSVIWAVAREVDRALKGQGRITICDAPQTDSSFQKIMERSQLHDLTRKHPLERGTPFEIIDLRKEEWVSKDGVVVEKKPLPGDPRGYVLFDLASRSWFHDQRTDNIYGADYDYSFTQKQHSDGHHRYLVSGSFTEADLVINLPKMKTHKKGGITCALKNMVGINGDKNYLPHHRFGSPQQGGDEFPGSKKTGGLESQLLRAYKKVMTRMPGPVADLVGVPVKKVGKMIFGDTAKVIRSGNWHGNDTVWRMTLDLNQILLWGRMDGTFRDKRRRNLVVVDGILAGEAEGPMSPDPVDGDILIVCDDPVVCDYAVASWMGFEPRRIPSVMRAFERHGFPVTDASPGDFAVESPDARFNGPLSEIAQRHGKRFRPHSGWKGHIERES